MNKSGGFAPGCSVTRWRPPGRGTVSVIIHDREYYVGKGDERGLRCEDWGKASRAWVRAMEPLEIVGAFVPYP